ncbi:MAG: substrate-binding domain-containing protein [Phenylobacterium sp.]|uniref:substrate-binding domain-containing protein n=1 Tax=Phenylobacterium sp. TaxID=1871053 RepID=UPI001A43C079|nr:substrate-binding domain-containing protein [Phenylobacterium sp.]MBL8555429.1 substrate-binding domain-containing protein [Phenylobacterium sp.]
MRRRILSAALAAVAILAIGACSSQGGKAAAKRAEGAPKGPMTVALITHAAPGDAFWDIVRRGAEAAAAKDQVTLRYASDADGAAQAVLVQNAIDSRVDAIAVTLAKPAAVSAAVQRARAAGIPVVVLNAGLDDWKAAGAMNYFGSDDGEAGVQAGKRAAASGFKHLLCVSQEQGHVALEARCDGLRRGFGGGRFDKVYVIGTDMPSVRSTVAAKLRQDPSIDLVVALGAPFALTSAEAARDAGSAASIATFDTNAQVPAAIRSGKLQWSIDQQPYLQGYLAVDALWLQRMNGNVIGGGSAVLTGPYFVDRSNVDQLEGFAAKGTR